MTLRELTNSLKRILTKNIPSIASRIEDRHLEFLIHQYRAKEIRREFQKYREIDPTWLQNMGLVNYTKVTSDDDPNIPDTVSDCVLGKFTIPTVVNMPDDMGVYRVVSGDRKCSYYRTTPDRFWGFVDGSLRSKFKYYFRIGNAVYIHPYSEQGIMTLILDNPLSGYVYSTENVLTGNLVTGTTYKVVSGQIVHNSTTYYNGDTFAAVNANFTGNGKVQANTQKASLTRTDNYPMSNVMADRIIMQIATQEYGIERASIGDPKEDAKDDALSDQMKGD